MLHQSKVRNKFRLNKGFIKLWTLFFIYAYSANVVAIWPFTNHRIIKNKSIPAQLSKDFEEQLKSFKNSFIKNHKKKILRPKGVVKKYLERVVNKIGDNNETLIPSLESLEVFFIKDSSPYLFSLPGYKIFISTNLMNTYIKNESVFLGALTYEIIKSGRKIYKKKLYVPRGYVETKEILKIVDVQSETKTNLLKWTFLALERAGLDGSAILNWIQIINRNSLEFSWYLVGKKNLSLEEFQFKTFLVSQGVNFGNNNENGSSRGFYRLKNWTD